MLALMVDNYKNVDGFGELWVMPQAEPAAGTAASGTITIAGTPTEAGVLNTYIGDVRVQSAVALSATPTIIAAALAAAINANLDLPVTATAAVGVVTVTAKWKGDTGNEIRLVQNYYGLPGGEKTPAGITVTNAATLTGGAGAPVLTASIAALGDEEYDFIGTPYTDVTSLNALASEMNDSTGRWSFLRQLYGGVFTAKRDTVSNLITFGSARNDQHASILGVEPDVLSASFQVAAAYTAREAVYLISGVARPTQTGPLGDIIPARAGSRFTKTEQQTLLTNGIATQYTQGGVMRISRDITTYQRNQYGQQDPSYFDTNSLFISAYVLRRLRYAVTQKYGRHSLANDGTNFGAGAAVVTPAVLKGEIIAQYKQMELEGVVENSKLFQQYLIVERNANDPNRLDVLFPPDYVNQLRVVAVLNQFRLQYQPASL